ncbi:MAG TPA: hypothetical protein DDZ89_10680, partial [Clostridiales bacterium]|nr:hypothetical protein [Clostridiales bacterium]
LHDNEIVSEYKASALKAESNNSLVDFFTSEKPVNPTNYIYTVDQGNLLPEGTYTIEFDHAQSASGAFLLKGVNEAAILEYEEALKEYEESVKHFDCTGTYVINLDAYKSSTLAGNILNPFSEFQLKDFELVLLEKEDEIEVIGKYEEIPFSQACALTATDHDKIECQFVFAIQMPNLPYKVDISVNATITLIKPSGLNPTIDIKGTAFYSRTQSTSKGADFNTYDIIGKGSRKSEELPMFVVTALGKRSGVGNIPGPDSTNQAVAGILFPPLAGLLVNVLGDMIKPKVRDKAWYMKKYPGKSEKEIAMIMLGDAMGSTDNPDEGDALSIGDNEKEDVTNQNTYEQSDDIIFEEDKPEQITSDDSSYASDFNADNDMTDLGGESLEDTVIRPDGTVEVSMPDGNILVCTTDGKTHLKTVDGSTKEITDLHTNQKSDMIDSKKASAPEIESDDHAAEYLRIADTIANIYGLSGIKEKAENLSKVVKEGLEASADRLRLAFAGGDSDDAVKSFTKMLRMSKTAENAKNVTSGISKGFEYAGIGVDLLNNMQDLNRADGSLIEGDNIAKAFVKSVLANKIASALTDKNPGIVVMEIANTLAFGGTEAGDIMSPVTNIKGAVNAVFDLVLDPDKAMDRVKAGAYGTNMKNMVDAGVLTKEALDDPAKFIKEIGEVGNDKEFFKGMQDTADSMFRDKDGNIGYFGAAAEATAQMGVAMTETAASMAKMTGEISGHLYENASMKIKSLFSW